MLSWFQSRGISSTDDKPLEEWTVENLKDLAKKNKPPKKYVVIKFPYCLIMSRAPKV